jgi:hypothetical protein
LLPALKQSFEGHKLKRRLQSGNNYVLMAGERGKEFGPVSKGVENHKWDIIKCPSFVCNMWKLGGQHYG